MSVLPPVSPADMQKQVGQEIGVSDWLTVDQKMIDAFAAVTGDHQFIHVDPARAAQGPFGKTIAHGFLTLSLLSSMAVAVRPPVAGARMGINYGFDKLRFLSPVTVNSRIRGRFTLAKIVARPNGDLLCHHEVSVEIENQPRPALIAEWLTMVVLS